jgi:hypothetical protein
MSKLFRIKIIQEGSGYIKPDDNKKLADLNEFEKNFSNLLIKNKIFSNGDYIQWDRIKQEPSETELKNWNSIEKIILFSIHDKLKKNNFNNYKNTLKYIINNKSCVNILIEIKKLFTKIRISLGINLKDITKNLYTKNQSETSQKLLIIFGMKYKVQNMLILNNISWTTNTLLTIVSELAIQFGINNNKYSVDIEN